LYVQERMWINRMKSFYKVVGDDPFTITPTNYAVVNGYSFGDRLLEDVRFKITIDANGTFHAEVFPQYKEYFNDLNTTKWLAEACRFAQTVDVYEDENDEIIFYDDEKPLKDQNFFSETVPIIVK
jgi:hypothetical protein